jgi:hypothetical protein
MVVLEVMWDWDNMTSEAGYEKVAPRHFRINPYNYTGRRLHWLLGHNQFLVTNACPDLVSSANGRGTPDPGWLKENLKKYPYDLLLICGRVAEKTFERCGYRPCCRIITLPHPAARGYWSKANLYRTRDLIQQGKH